MHEGRSRVERKLPMFSTQEASSSDEKKSPCSLCATSATREGSCISWQGLMPAPGRDADRGSTNATPDVNIVISTCKIETAAFYNSNDKLDSCKVVVLHALGRSGVP